MCLGLHAQKSRAARQVRLFLSLFFSAQRALWDTEAKCRNQVKFTCTQVIH